MPVDDFAVPRMKEGERRPVQSKQEARDWELLFIGDIKAGRDPKLPPHPPQTGIATVADLLDRYQKQHVDADGLRSAPTIHGRLKTLKQHLGHLTIAALERPDEIQAFKGKYLGLRSVATVNRVLNTLRGAINWGLGQTLPVLKANPFDLLQTRGNATTAEQASGLGQRPTRDPGESQRRTARTVVSPFTGRAGSPKF